MTPDQSLPAGAASPQPCEDKPYSFRFDKERDVWVCSIHGETNFVAWVPCYAVCDDGYYDAYDDDPINESPGSMEPGPECRGKGGWRVCGECNIKNPDAEF